MKIEQVDVVDGAFFLSIGLIFGVGYTQLFCAAPSLENALVAIVGMVIAYAGGRILLD